MGEPVAVEVSDCALEPEAIGFGAYHIAALELGMAVDTFIAALPGLGEVHPAMIGRGHASR